MDLKLIAILVLQVSIVTMVFGFGLKATSADLLYLFRQPGLLVRSLLAVFVIMPIVAIALSRLFDFSRSVEIVLMALAMSPVPPLLPMKETKAGGQGSYGLGLMATLALLSIVIVPAILEIEQRVFGRELTMAPGAIAGVVLKAVIAPLAAGMAIRALLPGMAARLERVLTPVNTVVLLLGIVTLVVSMFFEIWAFVVVGNIVALTLFTVAGLVIGHVFGWPNPEHSTALALSTACRHPAIALSIAATNFPNQRFGALILLYMLVNAVVGIPYVRWRRSRADLLEHELRVS